MESFLPDRVKDFFKFWKKHPIKMLSYGIACYAIGRWSMGFGLDIPDIPLI